MTVDEEEMLDSVKEVMVSVVDCKRGDRAAEEAQEEER